MVAIPSLHNGMAVILSDTTLSGVDVVTMRRTIPRLIYAMPHQDRLRPTSELGAEPIDLAIP